MSAIKLAAFDADGTILRGENVCGCIARKLGRTVEMDAFELFRSRDEIAAGRETMLEWYAPFDRAALIGHLSELRLAPGVKEGFARLKEAGVKIALVSITWEFAVGWFASELGADCAIGAGWEQKGTIVHFWPEDKASYLNSLIVELGINRDAVAAAGDSHGDIPMLNLASRSYFVGEHLPSELSSAKHLHNANIEEIALDILA
ncbi:haloacid dehalogenase-like hydrolase [Agrobacterium sp. MOPV5]|nr:haloacid dehalogenase-like hydrolase [Agrobacterium leguminum]